MRFKNNSDMLSERYLSLVFIILSFLFAISIFKNISYPLLWADESMTVMGGVRVLEYGYPKVHDGKNVFYDLMHPNKSLGIDERTDAYIGGANWGQYYFATIGIKMAELSNDFFTKTALLRIPFALAGLVGIALFALLGAQFFDCRSSKKIFLTLFVFFELISIPLVLHLREVRYYSLTVLLVSFTIIVYARYRILKKPGYMPYILFLTCSLFLLFAAFSPVYFILFAAIILFESIGLATALFLNYYKKRDTVDAGIPLSLDKPFTHYLWGILPLLISLIAVAPVMSFFRTFYIAEEMANYNMILLKTTRWDMYFQNLSIIWRFFTRSDFIYLAIFLKCAVALSFIGIFRRDVTLHDIRKLVFSTFLTIFFIIYFLAVARIPNFPFTRYFITLQPVLALMIIIDTSLVYNIISLSRYRGRVYYKTILMIVFTGFVFINISDNIENLRGHMYELSHQYRGPLDYLIPFIKERYGNTQNLVIATNYEETSFMYYLDAKVTVGFVGNNLEEDSQIMPDIISYRKWHRIFMPIFRNFIERQRYERISFPVADYPVNNVPELNWARPVEHQFRTWQTENAMEKVDLYVRQ